MNVENKGTVMLVAFNNVKALGVRYLETALRRSGYDVFTVFYGNFNSINPHKTSKIELELLCDQIRSTKPFLVGLSVMSSMYLDQINVVMETIQEEFDMPIVCGGAYATMCPEYFLQRNIDFVIRTDGESSICELADAIVGGSDYKKIPSLCYTPVFDT